MSKLVMLRNGKKWSGEGRFLLLLSTISVLLMLLIATPVEAKTINYSGLTIYHLRGDGTGIGGEKNHAMSITCGPTSVSINPFNTPINKIKAIERVGAHNWERWLDFDGLSGFPNPYYVTPTFTYDNSTPLMYFKMGTDKSQAVTPNVSNKSISFTGYTFQNLIPNRQYTVGYDLYLYNTFLWLWYSPGYIGEGLLDTEWTGNYYVTSQPIGEEFHVYTEAARPIISVSDIKDVRVTINWNPNGNGTNTSYTLQRRLNASQTWADIYTGTANQYTNTDLVAETTYQYRVRVNHIAGADWYAYSYQGGQEYVEVTTTANPAVAAAREAASQAQAAKEAAEQTLQYSSDAKNAAMSAEAKATEAVDLIKGLDTKFSAQLTNIQGQMQPAILSVKTTNGATATKTGSINIVATAINASQYRYRVNNGAFSEWQLLPVLNINSLSSGVNVIEVQATNSLEEGAPVSSGFLTVFRL